ncbi:DeoR/GlpR family DNA-binding transcription regulator [Paratractidigestivibacter sp.]|uniref:DeoR/GlpR family DNA-binding transcription regulator n=1 Tax=Paratractidigestivibacter sp. TaxID=2847316 RepID=UPI002AC8A9B8|nr:DeoR/GlpR family DNA-binding transcription regulator [Paratractidigestivibacter sp.]
MFPKQRREKIVQILDEQGHATVEELAARFSVSVDSIRKDLGVLAKDGLCRREYGGAHRMEREGEPQRTSTARGDAATPVSPALSDSPAIADVNDDTILGDEGRRAVAARAYMEINDGDAIFLDISRTNIYLADIIAKGDKRLIVTTNMMDIPRRLSGNPKVTALLTGGVLNPQLTGFIGSASISLLEPLLFAKAFIGCNGCSVDDHSVMADSMDDGLVKEKVLHNASYCFLLADHAKFGIKNGYRFASINDFSAVITDEKDLGVLGKITSTGTPALCC